MINFLPSSVRYRVWHSDITVQIYNNRQQYDKYICNVCIYFKWFIIRSYRMQRQVLHLANILVHWTYLYHCNMISVLLSYTSDPTIYSVWYFYVQNWDQYDIYQARILYFALRKKIVNWLFKKKKKKKAIVLSLVYVYPDDFLCWKFDISISPVM